MSKKTIQVSVTMWMSLIKRCDALIEPMTEDMRAHGGDASRAAVVRAAVYEGIRVLEERFLPDRTITEDEEETDEA
jgi:hypothetical protein